MFKKFGKRVTIILIIDAIVAIVLLSIMLTAESANPLETNQAPRELYIPDNCWTGGQGHPLPDHVIYDNRLYGPHMTDRALDSLFGDGKLDTSKINAFCSVTFDRAG